MEKQLEVLKALLEGKAVYDKDGSHYVLSAHYVVAADKDGRNITLIADHIAELSLTPPHKPLTFERIRKECVSGKHLLVDKYGNKMLFIGFNRHGSLVIDYADGCGAFTLGEHSIKYWTIEEYKGEE